MRGTLFLIGCLALWATNPGKSDNPPAPAGAPSKPAAREAEELFTRRIRPLLVQKCLACHGDDAKKIKGELDLRTREKMLRGGESGNPAVVPGKPEKSPLYVAVGRKDPDLVMPPKENDKLSPEEVEWIRQWIAAGAPWPEVATSKSATADNKWADSPDGVAVRTSGGLSPEWTNRKYKPDDIWAYQPIKRPSVPAAGRRQFGSTNPVDAFIDEKLRAKELRRTSLADRRTLIRRATFDLTGLPPSPAEVEAFLKDESADAFAKVIDRLLNNDRYGEQMAGHWLDVTRYADTCGFSNDFERPNAWRYRDYVIRSFNQDKPFDRFVMEQIAADEMETAGPESLIAVGFLRMGPWEHTGMTVAAVTRQQWLDDVTHSVGVTFLGQGLRCAQCHDHKFDPIPTKDYYRFQAVFATTHFAEREAPFQTFENAAGFAEDKATIGRRLKDAQEVLAGLRKKNRQAIAALLRERGVAKVEQLADHELSRRDNIGLSNTELSLRKIFDKRVQYFERDLQRFEPFAFSIYSGPSNDYSSNRLHNRRPEKDGGPVPVVHILSGGSLQSPSAAVTPGVLSALPGEAPVPEVAHGRRLALAKWLVSPENPLTARVIVNRVWQWHFGKGLLSTPNNFGKMGGRPSHPELLDWLARWFADNGWSIKKLHRLIMSSAVYQTSGEHPDFQKLQTADPRNDLLAYFPPRRLRAEEIRDGMLAVTGELNRESGGPGTFPEINWEVALQPRHIMGSVAPAYQPSRIPVQRNRRTIYTFRCRTLGDPLLEVFNKPGSETTCERRDETTVTPQAFVLMNGQFAHDRALALAAALEKQAGGVRGCVERAFGLVYGRQPTADEIATCEQHVGRMTIYHREHPPKPVDLPQRVRRHMVEEMTGEDVHWEEELDGLKNYQSDLKPWNVSPETRALADLCLALLNSNEFLYLR